MEELVAFPNNMNLLLGEYPILRQGEGWKIGYSVLVVIKTAEKNKIKFFGNNLESKFSYPLLCQKYKPLLPMRGNRGVKFIRYSHLFLIY